jgi:hypothetical protein
MMEDVYSQVSDYRQVEWSSKERFVVLDPSVGDERYRQQNKQGGGG